MSEPTELSLVPREASRTTEDQIDALVAELYPELRERAHRVLMRERTDHTLGTTGLVHETFLRFQSQRQRSFESREHFMAAAGVTMRRVLIDYARSQLRRKRGGGRRMVTLDDDALTCAATGFETVLHLEDAMAWLQRVSPRLVRLVECRFYGGMTDEETAVALGVTARTVRRDWRKAKGLLYDALERGSQSDLADLAPARGD